MRQPLSRPSSRRNPPTASSDAPNGSRSALRERNGDPVLTVECASSSQGGNHGHAYPKPLIEPLAQSTSSGGNNRSSNRSAFSWGESAGPVLGAALAGVAIGMAANYGRKFIMQGMEAAAGDWDEILAAEHDMALAIFDKMLATDETQTFKRKMLLMKLDPRARQACPPGGNGGLSGAARSE